jgi:hypothetical protein
MEGDRYVSGCHCTSIGRVTQPGKLKYAATGFALLRVGVPTAGTYAGCLPSRGLRNNRARVRSAAILVFSDGRRMGKS